MTLYVETWSQFVNKKHLIDETVKLAVAFFEYGKICSEIFRCRRMFVTEMLPNRRRSVSMLPYSKNETASLTVSSMRCFFY